MPADETGLLVPLFASPAMASQMGDRATVQAMLDVERALVAAQARLEMIPAAAAAAIGAACSADRYDLRALGEGAALAGNPAMPLARALTAEVSRTDAAAAGFVHRGATSQDVIDTGFVLRTVGAGRLLDVDLARIEQALATLAEQHRGTLMAGRTLLQQALPVTFGLKAAGWLSMIVRVRARLRNAVAACRVLQLGGAAGTLAAFGDRGLEVAAEMARELELTLPDVSWHAQRDRIAFLAAALGVAIGAVGKVARDIILLMQSEVGEVAEPQLPGGGGSSALPHKRNPVGATIAVAASISAPGLVASVIGAMAQEHERAAGGWHAEWQAMTELFLLASGAVAHLASACEGLEVDADRMRRNLAGSDGLILAEAVAGELAVEIGKPAADRLIGDASRAARETGTSLWETLATWPDAADRLSPADLARLADPARYLGSADRLIDRALQRRTVEPT